VTSDSLAGRPIRGSITGVLLKPGCLDESL